MLLRNILIGALIGWAAVVLMFSLFGAYDHERSTTAGFIMVVVLSIIIGFVYSRWLWVTDSER